MSELELLEEIETLNSLVDEQRKLTERISRKQQQENQTIKDLKHKLKEEKQKMVDVMEENELSRKALKEQAARILIDESEPQKEKKERPQEAKNAQQRNQNTVGDDVQKENAQLKQSLQTADDLTDLSSEKKEGDERTETDHVGQRLDELSQLVADMKRENELILQDNDIKIRALIWCKP